MPEAVSVSVEKIKFLDQSCLYEMNSEVSQKCADTYARQDIHYNTFQIILEKLRRLMLFYSLPAKTVEENGEVYFYIDLKGENLDLILNGANNEGGGE